jgi:hypothetical protein
MNGSTVRHAIVRNLRAAQAKTAAPQGKRAAADKRPKSVTLYG